MKLHSIWAGSLLVAVLGIAGMAVGGHAPATEVCSDRAFQTIDDLHIWKGSALNDIHVYEESNSETGLQPGDLQEFGLYAHSVGTTDCSTSDTLIL